MILEHPVAFAPENDPSKATSIPDFDNWGFDTYWKATDWMTWHSALKRQFGLDEANRKFITEWQKQSLFANPLDARSFDVTFRDYAKANGFFDALYYGLGSLAKPIGTAVNVISDVSDAVDSISDVTTSIAKPLIVIGLLVWAGSWAISTLPKKR